MSDKKGFAPEEIEQMKSVFGEIEKNIGTKMADQTKAAIDEAMKPVADEVEGLKKFRVEAEEAAQKNQKWIDEQIAKGKTTTLYGSDPDSFKNQLYTALEAKKTDLANYGQKRQAINFEMKAVGNIGANSNISVSGTPAFAHGSALSEPGRKPYEIQHVRDMGMRVVALGAMQDTYVVRDNGGEGAPTEVTAGAAKPQSDRDWVKTIVPITKIAHYYKVPEEYLADITWMQDEITGVGVEELLALEDTKLLTGTASSTHFAGLNATFNSTAFSAPASLALAINNANNYDVLVAAWTQLRNLKSRATGVLLHPSDYALMILTKDSQNNYVFGAPNQAIPNLFGAPIVPHTAVTSDKYFLGDFSKVRIGVRAGLSVRIFDQDQDDAIKNLVTIVIEERITMAADRADRIIYGDFSSDAAALETA
jgi:HK97 family phage major capsid protein